MAYERYEPVIGLEVHVQLQTNAKIFSPDAAAFGAVPNTQVDPISLGHPGTLPVLNETVVKHALRLGVATHCSIADRSAFARKHYFYPDLPKGYQISQYDTPICYDGYLEVFPGEEEDASPSAPDSRRVGLTRIHMEEDAGKSVHASAGGTTRLDYNRCGVPLLEMVTEPDLRSPREASLFLQRLRQLVRYLGISDGNMEEGSLRCDANVSVRPQGREAFGTRTELKNMNSMRHVEQALDYEIARQIAAEERGESITQQTLLWDADAGTTRPMRSKEEAHDYRYLPDPDLVEVRIEDATVDEVRANLPELPRARRRRFVEEVGLPAYDAGVLTEERAVADYFEEALRHLYKRTKGGDTDAQAKAVSNFIMTEVMRVLNERDLSVSELGVGPERLAQLVFLRLQDKVSSNGAQEVFEAMLDAPDKSAGRIADERDLIQVTDRGAIAPVVEDVLNDNPDKVNTYLGGKDGLLGFFIGQVMQRFDGSPNPELVRSLLREKLDARRDTANVDE
ncbi:aspartyl-tRNA(Asn)/glutamyl-tRNA(Gln) amidotransferase subunit B [Salinibacter ruber]|uniref:Asp-tRNA(Asn)/Glu-tRNA(Gln) amidotransferase subunit GatB n=1 Tax=Salinibacter ruber TaxID=146919 RepID=UPI00216777E3|nr:Asp-tRNA(Asn)/Glu-tRNA(Gln) amidotransferase subunit GatB [Salinibacter ruber]MCS3644652.1 aspartyl-tRNA(Asn)/glutamyl-tRNA(Gln) amidotransferase subunit B [Salinibacter ruber]MCS4178239.1 aspartyl-tRNA(Asn)/glutamyl-tRNA(Gln) amidotransferase subunit B [Salinibacter ruber]